MNNGIVNETVFPANPIDAVKPLIDRDSYGFVNTRNVLDVFAKHGWTPTATQFGAVRKAERAGFQKHLIRLENPEFAEIKGLTTDNRSKPQLVLLNSHDGTSSLQILWGLIRIACLNGIIAGTGINGVRLVHSKSITDKLPEAIQYMLDNFGKFSSQIENLQGKTLSQSAVSELTKTVYDARLTNVQRVIDVDYSVPVAIRAADTANDAYTVFNRLQEKLMRGGIYYRYERVNRDDTGKVVSTQLIDTRTRKIASVPTQVKLNQLAYDTVVRLAA